MTNEMYPAVFSNHAAETVSQKYSFVNTGEIIEMFTNEGWNVRSMRQTKTRDAGQKSFAAHEVRLQFGGFSMVGDTIPEVIITNSHNGKKPLQFNMGLFRLACTNGLTVPIKGFNTNGRIRHMGIEQTQVKELTEGVSLLLPQLGERVKVMQETEVETELAIEFLRESTKLRWDSGDYQFNYDDILTAKRAEDNNSTVWTVFNIAQEKLVQGEIDVNRKGKTRKARPIKNFIVENKINEKLWVLAEDMLLS